MQEVAALSNRESHGKEDDEMDRQMQSLPEPELICFEEQSGYHAEPYYSLQDLALADYIAIESSQQPSPEHMQTFRSKQLPSPDANYGRTQDDGFEALQVSSSFYRPNEAYHKGIMSRTSQTSMKRVSRHLREPNKSAFVAPFRKTYLS